MATYQENLLQRTSATISIMRRNGSSPSTTVATVPITQSSKRKFSLMQEDYVQLDFSLPTSVYFAVGDFINDPIFGVFIIADEQMPRYNTSTGGYDYSLRFDAEYMTWKNHIFCMTTYESGGSIQTVTQNGITYAIASSTSGVYTRKEASWNLTDKLITHASQILCNIKTFWNGFPYIVAVHPSATKASEIKHISYNGVNIIEALDMMADEWECEWWVSEDNVTVGGNSYQYVIHFGKCEDSGSAYELQLGDNVESLGISRDQQTFANRIYAYGGTRNIPSSYRKELVFTVTDATSGKYRDAARDIMLDMIEGVVVNEDVAFNDPSQTESTADGKSYSITWSTSNYSASDGARLHGRLNVSVVTNLSSNVTAQIKVRMYQTGNVIDTLLDETVSLSNPQYSKTIDIDTDYLGSWNYRTLSVNVVVSSSNTNLTVQSKRLESTLAFDYYRVQASTSITVDGDNYPVTFNPDGAENDTTEARYFSFDDAAPDNFGVGSQYTLNGINIFNIPNSYYSVDYNTGVLSKIGERRLRLPEGYNNGNGYVQNGSQNHYTKVIEAAVVFNDIFPHLSLKIASITTKQCVNTIEHDDGSVERQNWTQYQFTATKTDNTAFNFDTRYIMDGEKLQAVFTSPSSVLSSGYRLAGMTFDVGFDNSTQLYTIIRNEDYGETVPNPYLCPSVGDLFFLTGWNVNAVSSLGLVEDAENELKTAALDYLDAIQDGQWTFDAKMYSHWAFDLMAQLFVSLSNAPFRVDSDSEYYYVSNGGSSYALLGVGCKVTIIHPALPSGSKTSRVIGYEYKFDMPFDNPVYTIGETEAYSRLKQLEKQLTKLS